MKIQDLPEEERPRERLIKYGSDVLSLSELLAILMGNGTKGNSVLSLAGQLLSHFNGIEGLLEASLEELVGIKGIGMAKAIQLKAAFGLALRCKRDAFFAHPLIEAPLDAFHMVENFFYYKKKEMLAVILRDVRKRATHVEIIAIGSLTEVISHPREIYHPAIRKNAHSLIIAHNHPSGDPSPSKQDMELTKRLIVSGSVLGIPLDDHLILGSRNFVSLWQKGVIARQEY